jgi:hypothetical protein
VTDWLCLPPELATGVRRSPAHCSRHMSCLRTPSLHVSNGSMPAIFDVQGHGHDHDHLGVIELMQQYPRQRPSLLLDGFVNSAFNFSPHLKWSLI